jgi:hypothetical protein
MVTLGPNLRGTFDLIAVVAANSAAEMDSLIDRLGALDGVRRTTSAIILSTRIDR